MLDYTTRDIAYQTVSIFSSIIKRPLYLKNDSPARTDGRSIYAPFDDAEFYTHVEHELSHVLFKSDGRAAAQFVQDYSRLVVKSAAAANYALEARRIRYAMKEIIAILDDERVMGLWGELYPGSEVIRRTLKRQQSEEFLARAHNDPLTLFYVLAGGHSVKTGGLSRFEPVFRKALKLVEGKDFTSVLIVAKWVVNQLVDELLDEANTPDARAASMDKLVSQDSHVKPDLHDVEQDKYASRADQREAEERVAVALDSQVRDEAKLEGSLQLTQTAMEEIVAKAKAAIRVRRSEDDRLRKDAKAKVLFHDVSRTDVPATALFMAPEDTAVVRRLRSIFHRAMGRRVRVLEHEGVEVDSLALIQRRVMRDDAPVFQVTAPGRGFKTLLLLDRSQSMMGARTKRAERACRILGQALKFPFVEDTTWGFQSHANGCVDITRFAPGIEVFTSTKSRVGGNTPLHVAIHLAAKHLEAGDELKQLFVVSDGGPVFVRRDGDHVSTGDLMRWVRDEVQHARARGVRVTGVILGERKGQRVVSEVGPRGMKFMFGVSKHWRIMDEQAFDREFVKLVAASFMSYLKAG